MKELSIDLETYSDIFVKVALKQMVLYDSIFFELCLSV